MKSYYNSLSLHQIMALQQFTSKYFTLKYLLLERLWFNEKLLQQSFITSDHGQCNNLLPSTSPWSTYYWKYQ